MINGDTGAQSPPMRRSSSPLLTTRSESPEDGYFQYPDFWYRLCQVRMQIMQNALFLNILPGIRVGVSAPGAQLAQDSHTGFYQIGLT